MSSKGLVPLDFWIARVVERVICGPGFGYVLVCTVCNKVPGFDHTINVALRTQGEQRFNVGLGFRQVSVIMSHSGYVSWLVDEEVKNGVIIIGSIGLEATDNTTPRDICWKVC